MSDIVYNAMMFARDKHKNQVRKYTGEPYITHLAEVAAITASVSECEQCIATAWLHDCMEDQGVQYDVLLAHFGFTVAKGVWWLSDMEVGNRAQRKAAACARLSEAPAHIQTIKCADLISNTSSICRHDPKFAVIYLEEKIKLLEVLTRADKRLLNLAKEIVK